MTTLKDIAKRVGVDISTVSKVLQGAPIRVSAITRKKIEAAAREMSYRPNVAARSLRLGKSGALGLVMETTTNYLHPELIAGAEEAAEKLGYCLFLVKEPSHDPITALTRLVEQGRVDGLLHAEGVLTPEHQAAFQANHVPYISLNKPRYGDGPYVSLDDEAGFELQLEELVKAGHQRIVFIAVSPRSFVSDLCRSTFLRAAKAHAASGVTVQIIECDFFGEDADLAVETLLRIQPRPTAVATAGVLIAVRMIESLRGRGVDIPGCFSVLAYHDAPVAQWTYPGISTIKMPSRQQGHLGVERLVQILSGVPYTGELVQDPPVLVRRGSF